MIRNLIVFGTFVLALASLTAADATAQVTTNAALKALAAGSAPYIERAGYYAGGDGGGALYAWNATATCTDDGGSCIAPNSAPAQGRWILNQNGAVSVQVFGGCLGGANDLDDTPALNAALAARSAVFIPANTTCYIEMISPSSGLVLNQGNHLFGQNKNTSILYVYHQGYSSNYDFVAGGRFTSVVVASNVGTVTTTWSHELTAGESITIAGSATGALNGTYTIQSVPTPDTFTINTSGVSNGTFTDVAALTGPSGIGTDVIRSADRDVANHSTLYIEVDHLTIHDDNPPPETMIDMTSMFNSSFHDLILHGNGPNNGKMAFICTDQSPRNFEEACFFNDVYDVQGEMDTFLHISNIYGNVAIITFNQTSGYTRIGINSTGNTGNGGAVHSIFTNWYFDEISTNSWDFYAPYSIPANSTYNSVYFEGAANYEGYYTENFAWVGATPGRTVALPVIQADGMALPFVPRTNTTTYTAHANSTILCGVPGTPINLPASPITNGSSAQILTFRAWGINSTCVISGNGHTIEGSSSYTLTAPQTITMQWDPVDGDWRIVSQPAGRLPITTVSNLPGCGSNQAGMMYAVADAASPTYNGTLTGNGSTMIPVFCNGSAWTAH